MSNIKEFNNFIQKAGRRIKDNPNLVPKEVEIRPKRGNPYKAIRYVKRGDEEEEENKNQEDIQETYSEDIFDNRPRNNEEFIEQAKVMRDWMNENAGKASYKERQEKIKWYIDNSNDEEQNYLSEYEMDSESLHGLGKGVNDAQLTEYIPSLGAEGIFKSSNNEYEYLVNEIGGPLFLREVAAYKFSSLFAEFKGLVPVTSLNAGIDEKEAPYGIENNASIGSIQKFSTDAASYDDEMIRVIQERYDEYGDEYEEVNEENPPIFDIFDSHDVKMASILDSLMKNTDRHNGNLMEDSNYPLLIDNGCTFPTDIETRDNNLNTIIYDSKSYDMELAPQHRELVQSVLDRSDEVYRELAPYLDDDSISNIFFRAEKLLKRNVYGLKTSD